MEGWEGKKDTFKFKVKEGGKDSKKVTEIALKMKDDAEVKKIIEIINDNVAAVAKEKKAQRKLEKDLKAAASGDAEAGKPAEGDKADTDAAGEESGEKAEEKAQEPSTPNTRMQHETEIGVFLSEMETGSPERVRLSVPRVCTALASAWPDSSQWVAELKSLQKDGMLDEFLQSVKDNPEPAVDSNEEKKPPESAEATDTAEEDTSSEASASPEAAAAAPEPEPVVELGPGATGNPMNDDSTSDDDSDPGAD